MNVKSSRLIGQGVIPNIDKRIDVISVIPYEVSQRIPIRNLASLGDLRYGGDKSCDVDYVPARDSHSIYWLLQNNSICILLPVFVP